MGDEESMKKSLPSLEESFEICSGVLGRKEREWLREMFIMRATYVLSMVCLWKFDEEV